MIRRLLSLTVVTLTLLISWTLAAAADPASQPDKVQVKHAWPPGVYTMMTSDQSEKTMVIVGANQQQQGKSAEVQLWELTVPQPNDKGEKQAVLKLVRIKSNDQDGPTLTAFDSDKPANAEGQAPGPAFAYPPLIGLPIKVALDADDAVIEVTGLDAFWAELAKKAQTDEQKSAVAQNQIGLGDKAIEAHLRRWETLTPRRPSVAVGDTWQAGLRVPLPIIGEIKVRYDCKLAAVQSGLAVIASDGTYETTSAKSVTVMGASMTINKLNVQEKAALKVDLATGLARFDDGNDTMAFDISTKDDKGADVNLNIKVTSTEKTVVAPKKPGEAPVLPDMPAAPAPLAPPAGALPPAPPAGAMPPTMPPPGAMPPMPPPGAMPPPPPAPGGPAGR